MIKQILFFGVITFMQCEEDYYKILGLGRNATKKEIKSKFKTLSKKYHPDVSKEPDAEAKFRDVSEAYDVLIDDDKRKLYDVYGKEGLKETPSRRGGFDPFDFFGGGRDEEPT